MHIARDETKAGHTPGPKCRLCDGSGRIVVMRSWFHSDGYQKLRCGVCSGTGQSTYRCSPDYVREQKRMRARATGEVS